MEVIRVKEKSDDKIVFASLEDMKRFFDQINNGQGVFFDYVNKEDYRCGEYINPSIVTPINDGKIKIISKEKV